MPIRPVVSFTGTRADMTKAQAGRCMAVLRHLTPAYVCHGGCRGADRTFHRLVALVFGTDVPRHIYPGDNAQLRWALEDGQLTERELSVLAIPSDDYLKRDRLMVRLAAYVIATPKGTKEQMRGSGTWASIRYARKLGKPRCIIWPDGSTTEEQALVLEGRL